MDTYTDTREERTAGGFLFQTKEDAALASLELKKTEYLRMHLSYDNPEQVKQIYEKAVMERTFKTPVGYGFLWELRNFLLENGIPEEELEPIPLQTSYQLRKNNYAPVPKKKKQEKASGQPKWTVYSVILNVLLALAVAAMFAIATNGKSPNILNYEKAITNRYASWEQELTERENAVREKERELNIQ